MDTSDSVRPVGGLPAEGSPGLPLKIFINYRHEDMPFAAMMLYRELKERFGKENIFFDEGTLRPGMRFSPAAPQSAGRYRVRVSPQGTDRYRPRWTVRLGAT